MNKGTDMDHMVKDYTVYGTIMYSGEESVFSITSESKAEMLRLCEDDFGSNFRVNYIVASTEENRRLIHYGIRLFKANEGNMVKVVDEESGGAFVPDLGVWADLARKIAEAYGCNEATLFYGDKSLKVKVSEGCT